MACKLSGWKVSSDPEISELETLRKKAIRLGVWRSVDLAHRAAVGVVREVLRRGDARFIARIRNSSKVRAMIEVAREGILRALQGVRQLSFRAKAILVGARIACEKMIAYEKSGVFSWAPWLRQWLKDRETLYFLGSSYLGWS